MSFEGSRRPLADMATEARVLAAMSLHDRVCDDCLGRLKGEDFFTDRHRVYFDALKEIRRRSLSVDGDVIRTQLQASGDFQKIGGNQFILWVQDQFDAPQSYPSLVENILEFARLRALEIALNEATAKIHSGETSPEISSWLSLTCSGLGGSTVGIVEAGDVLRRGPIPRDVGLATGIRLIDEETATQGAPTGQLCVATASEGVGKSSLMLQLATNAAWELRGVLYVTLGDLNQTRLTSRVIRMRCRYTNVEAAKRYDDEESFRRAEYELKAQVSFGIDDRTKFGSDDVDDIIASIESRRQRLLGTKYPLQEAFIDYFQKLTSRHFRPNDMYNASIYCSKKLSRYAETSGLTLWVGSQITEGNAKQETRDITKGGRHLLEDAGLAVKVSAGKENARKFKLIKSRFGGQGQEADMVWNDEYLMFLQPGVMRPW